MDWERDGNSDCHASPTRLASVLPRGNVKQEVYIKRIKGHVSLKSGVRYEAASETADVLTHVWQVLEYVTI